MNNSQHNVTENIASESDLIAQLAEILAAKLANTHHDLLARLVATLNIDYLTCAAALLHLLEQQPGVLLATEPCIEQHNTSLHSDKNASTHIKMVRYRLDIGIYHQVTVDEIKRVLIEESGVDKNNINNVSIRHLYTLIELPDAMPMDIFHHLKTVEINQQKLAIRRVKVRNKKRGFMQRRKKPASSTTPSEN
ncbi:MAG: DbpA RNA binding domain-containing protein [Methylovulum sp.]|nr:DbpA RNA binding domain-containing protein [Methylovulum sp.]TSA40680.1 MAG: hypothetical protein D4R63_05230 [Methylococcaceae bacterium]